MNHRASLRRRATARARSRLIEERRLVYDGAFPRERRARIDLEADPDVGRSRRRARRVAAARTERSSSAGTISSTPRRLTYSPADRSLSSNDATARPNAFLERFHRRRGYATGYGLDTVWAVSVDLFIVAWSSGCSLGSWMWWEMKMTRRLGLTALVERIALFAFYLLTL